MTLINDALKGTKAGKLLGMIQKIKGSSGGVAQGAADAARRSVGRAVARRHGLIGERIAKNYIMPSKRGDPSRAQAGDSRVSTTESADPTSAASQMDRATGRAVDEAVSRIDRMESSLTEGIEGLETGVVSALRRMEDRLFEARQGYQPPARQPTPATIDDQQGYEPEDHPKPRSGVGSSLLKKIAPYLEEGGGIAAALRGGALLGATTLGSAALAFGGYKIGEQFVPDEKTIDERRKRREEIRNSPGVFHRMMSGLGSIFGDSLKAPGVGSTQEVKGKTITFKAKRIEFKFDQVSGMIAGIGGAVTSPGVDQGGPDDSGDQGPPGPGGDYRAGSSPSEPAARPAAPSVGDVSKPLDKRGLPPAKPSGIQFKNPFQDPSKRGLEPFQPAGAGMGYKSPVAGTDLNDTSSVPFDGGSKNSRSFGGRRGTDKLHTGVDIPAKRGTPVYAIDEGIIRRADSTDSKGYGTVVDIEYPKYGVVMRNAHLNSMDVKVGDKVKRGQEIGQVGDSGNASKEGFTHDHFEVIKLPYYNEHGGRPPGRASSQAELDEGREDPRRWFREHLQQAPVSKVFSTKPAGKAEQINASFDKGNKVQPQGFQPASAPTPPPVQDKAKPQVIVKGLRDDPDTSKDDRVKKRNRFYKGDKQDRDEVTFSQYMNVEHDEGIA